jgi:geranylgeranyl reductase family protein
MWDVLVVGSGPAGASAAIAVRAASRGARVALADRADFPRDKTCGDGVAPHVLDVLGRLGVRGLLDDWTPVPRMRLGFPDGPSMGGTMRRPTFVVPREVLDARIRAAALDRGVEPLRHRVRSLVVEADRVVVDGDLEARVVIGADGAHSAVAGALGVVPAPGNAAIALRAYVPLGDLPADEQVIVFGHGSGVGYPAYAWAFPVGDGRANVGYGELIPADGAGPNRAELLDRLHALIPGLGDLRALRGHHLPLSTSRLRQPDGPVLLAGDALGLINPITGEGIHAAVLSGALAGLAAARSLRLGGPAQGADAGRMYRDALRSAYGRHTRDVNLLARLARPRAVAAGLRGAAGNRRAFDDLVELGLAEGSLTPAVAAVMAREVVRKAGRMVA